MAKFKSVLDRIWNDNYVSDLKSEEKFLFVYLLTNHYMSLIGIYEMSIRTIAFETAIEVPRINEILEKFGQDKKIHYTEGHIIIRNFYKHTSYNHDNVRNCAIKQIKELPTPIQDLYADVLENIIALTKPKASPSQGVGKGKASPTQAQPALSHTHTHTHTPSHSNSNTLSTPPTPSGDVPGGANLEGGGVSEGDSRKAGGGGSRTIDVHLTEEELKKLVDEYGDEAILSIPYEVLDWSEEKGIPISNMYKMCVSFIKARIKKGTWQG